MVQITDGKLDWISLLAPIGFQSARHFANVMGSTWPTIKTAHAHTQTVCKLIACVMRTEKKWGSINISRVYTQGRNGALSWARNRRRNCLSLGIYCYNDDQNSFPRDYYDNFFFSQSHADCTIKVVKKGGSLAQYHDFKKC